MKFSIGDRIVLNRTGEEGFVTAFINTKMLEVEVNGTVFPVHLEDIDHPYMRWFTDKNKKKKSSLPEQLPVEKIPERKAKLAKGIYLSFMPVFKTEDMEERVDVLKVYLLNELPHTIKYVYDMQLAQKSEFRHEGVLHAFGNVYLHSVDYGAMNDQPRFNWQVSDPANMKMAVEEGTVRIKPAKLFAHIDDLLFSGAPTFSYLLTDGLVEKKAPEHAEPFVAPHKAQAVKHVTAQNLETAKYELDLHIEQLLDDRRGLSNADIVYVQLEALKHNLHLAIAHRQDKMIVIHGLGKGRLKEEVHAVLKQTQEVSRFKNEWSAKYGFGATEVFFRY